MRLSEAIAEEARRFSKTVDKAFSDLTKPIVNISYKEVGKSWDWPELDTYGSIVAVPIVEGSVSVTTDSYTVTIAGSSTDWKGRFFRKKGGDNDYRIVFVSGNTVTLDQPIIESGTIDYEIEKRFYPIPTEVRNIISFENRVYLTSLDNNALRQHLPNYSSGIVDNPFSVHGIDKFTDDYAVGTVSADADSNVITGASGMLWLANAKPGNIIRFGNVDYRIRRVETDTRIISYNKVPKTTAVAYTISSDSAKTIRMRGTFTTKKVIPFQYIRSVYDMVHNDDTMDLSEEAQIAVLDFAEAYLASGPLRLDDWAARLIRAQARLVRAQSLAQAVKPAFRMFPLLIPRGLGR